MKITNRQDTIVGDPDPNHCIIVVDIETTNTSAMKGYIIEVGVVALDLRNGNRKTLFDNVCYEEGMKKKDLLDSWIIKNSSMELKQFVGSRTFDTYLPELQEIFDTYDLGTTAFNIAFDTRWLKDRDIRFHRLATCLMKAAKPHVDAKNKNGGKKNPNCEEAYTYYFGDKNYVEEHRGAADAFDEAGIAYKMFQKGHLIIEGYEP